MPRHALQAPPSSADTLRPLAEIASVAGGMQEMGIRQKAIDEQNAAEGALKDAAGDPIAAASTLEKQGLYLPASRLRQSSAEIQKAQREALSSQLDATEKGFKQGSQLLMGINEAKDPEAREAMYATVRPQLVKLLPGMESYIPPTLAANPSFVDQGIALGQSASEHAAYKRRIVDTLNDQIKTGTDQLALDGHVTNAVRDIAKRATTGEEINQAVQMGQSIYRASPAVAARVGQVPPGPIDEDTRATLLARLEPAGETSDKTAEEARKNDFAEYKEFLTQYERTQPKTDALTALVAAISASTSGQDAIRIMGQAPKTTAYKMPPDFNAWRLEHKGIDANDKRLVGSPDAVPPKRGMTTIGATPAGAERQPAPPASPYGAYTPGMIPDSGAPAAAPAGGSPTVASLLQDKPDGRFTLTDGTVWEKSGNAVRQVQ